ncbi:MAG: hypothetical protein IKU79_06680 [Bacteroidaceae bacterium]|jgi:hypothetical protein|nr:hypothetical protein [Bacteroidaceae bacterium]
MNKSFINPEKSRNFVRDKQEDTCISIDRSKYTSSVKRIMNSIGKPFYPVIHRRLEWLFL